MVLSLLIGGGAYVWYQMDRRALVTLLDRQIEMYLPDLAVDTAARDAAALTADLPPILGAGAAAGAPGAASDESASEAAVAGDVKPR